jgi:hypothetical protein
LPAGAALVVAGLGGMMPVQAARHLISRAQDGRKYLGRSKQASGRISALLS